MTSPSRRGRSRRWLPGALAPLLAVALGCDSEPPAPAAPARPPEPAEPVAEAAPAPSPWPTAVRSLEESLDDFESVEACIASMRASLPVEVAELFYDLGYDDALGEVCRSLAAAKSGDPSGCDGLVSRAVRRRCRLRVAALHEQPEACPEAVGSGRDATCLAWATVDASLCDGAPAGERATCLAVATADAERCGDPLGLRSAASCRALVARLEGVVDAAAPPERPAPELALSDSDPPLRLPTDAARTLDRGVVATVDGCRHQVRVETRPSIGGGRGVVGLTLALRLSEQGATLAPASEVAIGPVGTSYSLAGEVTLDETTERRLGGPLLATFEGRYTRDGSEHTLSGRLRTFFRDLPPLPERCASE